MCYFCQAIIQNKGRIGQDWEMEKTIAVMAVKSLIAVCVIYRACTNNSMITAVVVYWCDFASMYKPDTEGVGLCSHVEGLVKGCVSWQVCNGLTRSRLDFAAIWRVYS